MPAFKKRKYEATAECCKFPGGKILMTIREEIRSEMKEDNKIPL